MKFILLTAALIIGGMLPAQATQAQDEEFMYWMQHYINDSPSRIQEVAAITNWDQDIDLAQSYCQTRRLGSSHDQVFAQAASTLVKSSLSEATVYSVAEYMGAIMAAGRYIYCPEFSEN